MPRLESLGRARSEPFCGGASSRWKFPKWVITFPENFSQFLVKTLVLFLALLLVREAFADDEKLLALLQQGDLQFSHHQPKSALAAFQQAEKLDPNRIDVLLRLSQQYSGLIAEAKNPADAQRAAAMSLSYAKRSVETAGDNPKSHLALAVAYGRLTDFVGNKTKLEYSKIVKTETLRSIVLDPTDDYAYHVLGRWNYSIANLNPVLKFMAKVIYGCVPDASNDEAVRYFKHAIEIAPQRIIHHHELARTYVASGKRELARKEWQAILDLPTFDDQDEQAKREAKEALRL